MDTSKQRFLQDRVMTASPAQRVVMLYDRLWLDLTRANQGSELATFRQHTDHAFQIVVELIASLDTSVGGPAENLAQIYGFLLRELIDAQLRDSSRIDRLIGMVDTLRVAWTAVAEGTATVAAEAADIENSRPAALPTSWTA